jgi:hypothetical protein
VDANNDNDNNDDDQKNDVGNIIEELQSLVDNIKQVYYQDYDAVYGEREINKLHF